MQNRIIIVEGQTERHFVRSIKKSIKLFGAPSICNVCQDSFGNQMVLATRIEMAWILLDTDLCQDYHMDKLRENIKKIKAKKTVILLQQNNFEEELIFAMGLRNQKQLNEVFSISGDSVTEFKNKFLKLKEAQILKVCSNKNGLELHKLFLRGEEYKSALTQNGILSSSVTVGSGKQFFYSKIK